MAHIHNITVDNSSYLIEPTLYGVASTLDSGVNYTVALTDFELDHATGVTIYIKFPVTNKNNNTKLNVNSTGAKDIYYNNAAITASMLTANHIYALTYDGTRWQVVGDINTDEKVSQTPTTTNADYELLFSESANNNLLTEGARKTSTLKYNPNSKILTINGGTLTGTNYSGKAATAGAADTAGIADTANAVAWTNVNNRPTKLTLSGTVSGSVDLGAGELTLSTSVDTIKGVKYYAYNTKAGNTYVGWVKIASFDMNEANHYGNYIYDVFINRRYSSPSSEVYSLRICVGWMNTTIILLNGRFETNDLIIDKFRIIRDTTNHKGYLEYHVKTNYNKYENVVNITIINYCAKEFTTLNEVLIEDDSTFSVKEEINLTRGIAGYGADITDLTPTNLTGVVSTTNKKFLKDTGSWALVDWDDLTGTPTTLAGYGITDAATAADYVKLVGDVMTGDLGLKSVNDAITTNNKCIYWETNDTTPVLKGYITVSKNGKMGIHATKELYLRPGDTNENISTTTGIVVSNSALYPYNTSNAMTLGIKTRNEWSAVYATNYYGSAANMTSLTGASSGNYGPSAAVSGTNGTTMNVPYISVDANGRITSISNKVYTAVNTWRGIQDSLESDSTTESLSAAKGKALATGSARDSTKLPKITYEYNKEISFGSSGKLLIGKFPCYDSNITIQIHSTTSTTYYAVAVMATLNINESAGGTITWKTYGDSANTVTPNLYAKYVSGSRNIEIYFSPSSYSKNYIHIACVALRSAPTNICENVESIPSDATKKPTNTLNFSGTSFTSGKSDIGEHDADKIKSNGVWSVKSNGPATVTGLGAQSGDMSLYTQFWDTSWGTLIASDYRDGQLFVRALKQGTWQSWYAIPKFTTTTGGLGSTTQPVYIDTNGELLTISYTIAKSVPSDAKFTDTNKYHKTGSWGGTNNLTYTATAVNSADALAFTLATASTSTYGVTKLSAAADNSGLAATAKSVYDLDVKVDGLLAAANAMTFKGIVNTDSDLPVIHEAGDTYRVGTAGEYRGKLCEIGTLIICVTDRTTALGENEDDNNEWTSVETNEDGSVIGPASVTATNNIALFDGTTGRIIKDSGVTLALASVASAATISTAGGSAAKFWRGDNSWSDTIDGGTLKIKNNGITLTIGSTNTSWVHFTNDKSKPFYFGNQVTASGGFKVYDTTTTLTSSGLNVSSNTDSSSTATGSIITAGGAGIAKTLYVGTGANITGQTIIQTTTAPQLKIYNSSATTGTDIAIQLLRGNNTVSTSYVSWQLSIENKDLYIKDNYNDAGTASLTSYTNTLFSLVRNTGDATFKGTITAKSFTVATNDDAIAHLLFGRSTYNYIAFPSGGELCINGNTSTMGTARSIRIGITTNDNGITSGYIYPGKTNVVALGSTDLKWSSVYATTFYGNLSGNASSATSATKLANQGRITNANIPHIKDGGMRLYLATGTMTSNKPSSDGSILHFHWDNDHAWDSQLFISDNGSAMLYRGSQSDGVWGAWKTLLDSNNTASGTNNAATLTWGTTYTIAKINSTDIKFTTMSKPSYAFTDLTSHPTTLSGYGITDAMASSTVVNKVKTTVKSDNVEYKLLMSAGGASPTSGSDYEAVYDTDVTLNPSTHTLNGIKLKSSTRIYPFVATLERSTWYKITFPYSTATTNSSTAKWFMNSFDLHFGGGYSANATGVAHVTFYWSRAKNNGAWTATQVSALMEGIYINKIHLYYRIAEPGILYVKNDSNKYNGIWLDNLFVDDTSPTLDWSTTKIETCSAITDSTNPALSAYTVINTARIYTTDGTQLKTNVSLDFDAEKYIYFRMNRKKSGGGGWAGTYVNWYDNADNIFARIGVFGNADTLSYLFLGAENYNSTKNLKILPSGRVRVLSLDFNETASYGSSTLPIYWNDGVPVECTAYADASVSHADTADTATNASDHIANTSNPHSVTKTQVGLSNVTNDAQVTKAIGTAKGDIIYWSAASTPARLGIGSEEQYLSVISGIPEWRSNNIAYHERLAPDEVAYGSNITYDTHTGEIIRNGGTAGWNTGLYSTIGYKECRISFRPNSTGQAIMVGLNADPTNSHNYTDIDYCWYLLNGSASPCNIYESGSSISSIEGHKNYKIGDEFAIEFYNGNVYYYHNNVLCRTVARTATTLLYMDSSFHGVLGKIKDLRFTPIGNCNVVSKDAPGLAPKGAAVSSQSTSTKFLREDGTWAAPSYIANAAYGNINTSGQINQSSGWTLASGDGLLVFDSSNSNKIERSGITFDASTTTQVLSKKGTWVNMYTHPTGAGNNHIPSGGSSGQFLKYSSSGVATWSALPTASTSAAGIIQIGTGSNQAMAGNTTVTNVAISADTTANKKYSVVFGTTANDGSDPTTAKTEGLLKNSTKLFYNPSTGSLSSIKYSVDEKVTLEWNSTDLSLDFVFA